MPRDIVLGNGQLLVNLDKHLSIRDVYYPYVGWANHVGGYHCRVGFWVEGGEFCWLNDEWEWQIKYDEHSLVSDCTAKNKRLGLRLQINHAVVSDRNAFLQRILVNDLSGTAREVRVFLGHDLRIDESDIGDTTCYQPTLNAIVHYKRDRYFLFSGEVEGDNGLHPSRISQYACGQKGFRGAEGTWRDGEDGVLSMNAISQGAVDSVLSYTLDLPASGTTSLRTWMTVGSDMDSVAALQSELLGRGFEDALARTREFWKQTIAEVDGLDQLPTRVADLARRSAMIVYAHCDRGGAIIASSDSDIMETERAHYAYTWPRDGALTAIAMDGAGIHEPSRAFFEYCVRVLPKDKPFLLHKYGPDGTLGASWHPWISPDGKPETPFQADGTALVLHALWLHVERCGDSAFAIDIYKRFVRPAADFLMDYREPDTHLPLPCWDLWEERRGTHIFTVASTCAAFRAASKLASLAGDTERANAYEAAFGTTRDAMITHLYDEEGGYFVRMVKRNAEGALEVDKSVDSSAFAVFAYGVLEPNDPRVVSTMRVMGKRLWVRAGVGGLARYERDYYFHVTQNFTDVPGNPWIICTLWLADWYIATANSESDLKCALDLLEWAAICSLRTGVLSEQIHPFTLEPLSVAPLTWSHAQYLTTVTSYVKRLKEIGGLDR